MYTLVTAIAKALGGDERWSTVDISNMPLDTIYDNYSEVIATLTNPFLTGPVALKLASIRSGIAGQTITFNQYLASLGNVSLPTYTPVPTYSPTYAHYADAFAAGYKVQPIAPNTSITADVPIGTKTNLYMTRDNTDYNSFYESCLVNVNGFYHQTSTDGNAIYVTDGMKSRNISKQNQLGIYSFKGVGNLSFVPITPQMIYKQNNRQSLSQHCFVNIGQDVSQKTIMLVLGGYLHVFDPQVFFRISPTTICINFENMPFLDRYYESKKYIDLSSLPLDKNSQNANQVGIDNFYSDANIIAYLGLSQSFIVIMDNPNIFVGTQGVRVTKNPDMFICYEEPRYWSVYEEKQWSLNCHDSFRRNYVYDTVNIWEQNSVDARGNPFKPNSQSQAYFLKVGTDLI